MKSKNIKYILILSAVFLGAMFCGVKNSQAIEYEMLGGRPANPDASVPNSASWFIYHLNPGEVKEDVVEVMNLFSEEWTAFIYASDTTKSSSGGFALEQSNEPKDEVGAWVKFYPDSPPESLKTVFTEKENKIIPFCAMSREDINATLNEKIKLKSNWKEITDENFSAFQTWCAGVDSVEEKMDPQARVKIPFVIRVPENSDVGEHTGGILIERKAHEAANTGGSSVNLVTRVGVRIYETVPGEVVKKLALDSFDVIKNFKEFDYASWFSKNTKPEEYLVQMKIKNDGNVSVMHENIIHVKNLIFNKGSEDVSRNFQVLKKDIFISNYSWKNPRFGYFSFATEIKYKNAAGEDRVLNSEPIKIWIIPWREIAVAIAILLLAFGSWWGWKKYQKKRYGGVGWVEYKVKKSDNVNSLAKKFAVDWKVLVKTNKIKPPYLLGVGQSILVPSREEEKRVKNAVKKDEKEKKNKGEKEKSHSKKVLLLTLIFCAVVVLILCAIWFYEKELKNSGQMTKKVFINNIDIGQQ
jgi:hypothetical protein